jgi:CDP-diglyceride synthetase
MKEVLPAAFWRATEMAKSKSEAIAAMICITILEAIALYKGIDGTFLTMVIAVIAGLGGFYIGRAINNDSNTNR